MELWDIGVNLTHRRFARDREAVVARARAAGVSTLVITGTSVAGSRAALALARDGLLATVGVHPHVAKDLAAAGLAELRVLAGHSGAVAIGECGLDFDRDFSPRPAQERVFAQQLALAGELGLPVFLHERAAHQRFTAILKEHRAKLAGGVVHCFTGSAAEADAYLELGLHLGITGWICDDRRGTHLADVVRRVPADRLMLETDAPFLTPRDLPRAPAGNRNEPAFLPHVAAAVARARGASVEAVAEQTTQTARAFFARRAPAPTSA